MSFSAAKKERQDGRLRRSSMITFLPGQYSFRATAFANARGGRDSGELKIYGIAARQRGARTVREQIPTRQADALAASLRGRPSPRQPRSIFF